MVNRREFVVGAAAGLGAVAALPAPSTAAQQTVSLNAIYPSQEGARFDLSYYRSTHIPLAMKVMNAASVVLIEGMPMGDTPAPYVMIAHFQFPSSEALQAGLANPAMADVRADIAKFTDIRPTIMLGRNL